MKVLLTGANGYIGKRLIPILSHAGHDVVAIVRDKNRFVHTMQAFPNLEIIEYDFLNPSSTIVFPANIDAAYYLMHSMTTSANDFKSLEEKIAEEFVRQVNATKAKQIIFLGALSSGEASSQHMQARRNTETILKKSIAPITILRAGIIVGSGSASFEIIRDLVEKLPIMIAPKWLNTKIQPIAIRNVTEYLLGVLHHPMCINKTFDIGGPDILTYKEMLLVFATTRHLKRWIFTVPIMTPKLSSYWLYFITATSYYLAVNLVKSLYVEVLCTNADIQQIIPIKLLDYKTSIEKAFLKIEQNEVVSSWKDSMTSGIHTYPIHLFINVPTYGCYKDNQQVEITQNVETVLQNIWKIGGNHGWYYANTLWQIRGFIDKLVGGVGLRRGRTNDLSIETGDALDFWRVIYADKWQKRLLLFAEMKLPGEAWLEFNITEKKGQYFLHQTATFRPLGLSGRLYWWLSYPFHLFIFKGMARKIAHSN